jgi:hypothetical protein
MVVDWFEVGAGDGCLADGADNLRRMNSGSVRRKLKPTANFEHREDFGERQS